MLLADIGDFAAVNEVYSTFFTSHHPARAAYQVPHLPAGIYIYNMNNIYSIIDHAAYQVAALPRGARIEIEAVAVVGDIVNVE